MIFRLVIGATRNSFVLHKKKKNEIANHKDDNKSNSYIFSFTKIFSGMRKVTWLQKQKIGKHNTIF